MMIRRTRPGAAAGALLALALAVPVALNAQRFVETDDAGHPKVKYADSLVERIYQRGGLAWCSRHDLVDPDDAPID